MEDFEVTDSLSGSLHTAVLAVLEQDGHRKQIARRCRMGKP